MGGRRVALFRPMWRGRHPVTEALRLPRPNGIAVSDRGAGLGLTLSMALRRNRTLEALLWPTDADHQTPMPLLADVLAALRAGQGPAKGVGFCQSAALMVVTHLVIASFPCPDNNLENCDICSNFFFCSMMRYY